MVEWPENVGLEKIGLDTLLRFEIREGGDGGHHIKLSAN